MFVAIINDSSDANALGRQATRAAALIGGTITTIGVKNELEAAGNLVDILDAANRASGIILVNVAPRSGAAKKWKNGTPFGYFYVGKTLVISSIDGFTLSLVTHTINLVETIDVFDIPTVMNAAVKQKLVTPEVAEQIVSTQFRSFEFLPRAASWLLSNVELPHKQYNARKLIAKVPPAVWLVDNFGNCKTTVFQHDLKKLNFITKKYATLPLYNRLSDVPDGKTAWIIGSSGFEQHRFLELIIQGGDASKKLGLKSGTLLV